MYSSFTARPKYEGKQDTQNEQAAQVEDDDCWKGEGRGRVRRGHTRYLFLSFLFFDKKKKYNIWWKPNIDIKDSLHSQNKEVAQIKEQEKEGGGRKKKVIQGSESKGSLCNIKRSNDPSGTSHDNYLTTRGDSSRHGLVQNLSKPYRNLPLFT